MMKNVSFWLIIMLSDRKGIQPVENLLQRSQLDCFWRGGPVQCGASEGRKKSNIVVQWLF